MMKKLLASTAMMAMAASTASATTLFFKNSCEFQIDLYDNGGTHPLAPGATHTRYLAPGFKGMFRHGQNPQATLAEFTVLDGKSWFDISIIPTGPRSGPDYCPSLNDCKSHTGGVGYNVQMQIAPRTNSNGAHCRTLTCMYDGCPDAYQYPKDDTKTHNCPDNTDFDLTFCPGGKGGETPAPTTPAPTTPAPTTPEPTTPAPTNATEDRSMDALLESGVTDKSGAGSVGTVTLETPEPTPEPTTATPVGTSAAPAVEANTQSSASSGSGIAGTIVLVLGAMAAVAGVAMIVVIRRKKAALDAMEDKNDSIILRTSTAAL